MPGCTLVSSFFPIKSKFPPINYLVWGETFLSLDASLVLFTTPQLAPLFKEKRRSKPTLIVSMEFEEIDSWRLYKSKWIAHHAKDPEKKNTHTPELYAIWAQKAFFVEKAVHMNVFSTEYFFWCDFGAFRDIAINQEILRSFPHPKYLLQNKILFQSIGDMKPSDKIVGSDGIPCDPTQHEDRIVGGLWGGGATACLKWKAAYQQMLEAYFAADRFAGKDQHVMLSALLKDPSLGIVVNCTRPGINKWFFLEHLLSEEPNIFEINTSYF